MHAIEIENLSKAYGTLPVLRDLTLAVREGEVFGLLGPNGAGKSTLLHLLLGFLQPSAGVVRVLGTHDLELARKRVGYIPERLRYHTRYNAREYLRFLGQFSDIDGSVLHTRVDEELERVGLSDAANRQIGTFSKGMLQRLGIAQALLHEPDLLLIDEPTSGLDPTGQREMIEILSQVRAQGRTILMTTHYMEEVEQLCDRIGVLNEGRLMAEADVQQLRIPSNSVLIVIEHLKLEVAERLRQLSPAVYPAEREVLLRPNTQELQAQVLRLLLDNEIPIIAVQPQERPLERLYAQAVRGEVAAPAPSDQSYANPYARPAPRPPAPPDTQVLPRSPAPTDGMTRPPAAPAQENNRPGEGDTLLRELLRRDKAPPSNSDEQR